MVVQRPEEAPVLPLLERVGVQERAVGRHGRGVVELDPHLDPAGLRDEGALEPRRRGGRAPPVGVAERPKLHRYHVSERNEDVLGRDEVVLRGVVELDVRRPGREDADDPEIAVLETHRPPDAVPAAEELLVHLLRDHGDGLRVRVGLRVPRGAVLERHQEHREEVRETETGHLLERTTGLGVREDVERRLEHPRLPRGDLRLHDLDHVAIRDLRRNGRAAVRRVFLLGIPGVQPHVVKDAAFRRDRIACERVPRGGERGRERDAERDTRDDERRERPVALHALVCDVEVVQQHGVVLRRAPRRGWRRPASRGARRRPAPRDRSPSRPGGGSRATHAPRTRARA